MEVQNWNKNEISIQATVTINNNKDNKYFTLKSDKIGKSFTVKSDYGDLFKKNWSKNGVYNNCKNQMDVNLVIYVPKNMELKVKSISGSVDALAYNGQLTLDLISGNITVKKHSKEMNLKTISGDIDVVISDAEFRAETLTGTVYSDLDIDFNNTKKRSFGSKIIGTVKKGVASLKLKTISGDIFLRKS